MVKKITFIPIKLIQKFAFAVDITCDISNLLSFISFIFGATLDIIAC